MIMTLPRTAHADGGTTLWGVGGRADVLRIPGATRGAVRFACRVESTQLSFIFFLAPTAVCAAHASAVCDSSTPDVFKVRCCFRRGRSTFNVCSRPGICSGSKKTTPDCVCQMHGSSQMPPLKVLALWCIGCLSTRCKGVKLACRVRLIVTIQLKAWK
jgi:hypothetical protein